jgi:hypothetical protein
MQTRVVLDFAAAGLGLQTGTVRLVPAEDAWANIARALAADISRILDDHAIEFDRHAIRAARFETTRRVLPGPGRRIGRRLVALDDDHRSAVRWRRGRRHDRLASRARPQRQQQDDCQEQATPPHAGSMTSASSA